MSNQIIYFFTFWGPLKRKNILHNILTLPCQDIINPPNSYPPRSFLLYCTHSDWNIQSLTSLACKQAVMYCGRSKVDEQSCETWVIKRSKPARGLAWEMGACMHGRHCFSSTSHSPMNAASWLVKNHRCYKYDENQRQLSNTNMAWNLRIQVWDLSWKLFKNFPSKQIIWIYLSCEGRDVFSGYANWIDEPFKFEHFATTCSDDQESLPRQHLDTVNLKPPCAICYYVCRYFSQFLSANNLIHYMI